MQVIVRDRREGKTTELVKWLLEGKEQSPYPQWSRVIVAPTHAMVTYTTRMVFQIIHDTNWMPRRDQLLDNRKGAIEHAIVNVRKAVWGMRDLGFNMRGSRDFEYALDDAEQLLLNAPGWVLIRPPAIITMTGKLYDDLGN